MKQLNSYLQYLRCRSLSWCQRFSRAATEPRSGEKRKTSFSFSPLRESSSGRKVVPALIDRSWVVEDAPTYNLLFLLVASAKGKFSLRFFVQTLQNGREASGKAKDQARATVTQRLLVPAVCGCMEAWKVSRPGTIYGDGALVRGA